MTANDYSTARKPLDRVLIASSAGMVIPSVVGAALILTQRYEGLIINHTEFITLAVIALVSAVVFAITVSVDLNNMSQRINGKPSKEDWEKERMQRTLQSVQNARQGL